MKKLLQEVFLNSINNDGNTFISRCIEIVYDNIDNKEFGVKVLAREIGMSHSSLYKKIKETLGYSVNKLIRIIRLTYVSEMFINSTCSVSEAAYSAGFNDLKYFRKQFKEVYNVNPSEYRKKHFLEVRSTVVFKKNKICYQWASTNDRPAYYDMRIGDSTNRNNSITPVLQ